MNAPFDGLVSEWSTRPHETVREGDPVIKIVSNTDVLAKAQIPASVAFQLESRQTVDAVVSETGMRIQAVAKNIAPVVEPVSRTVTVIFDLKGSSAVKPGMSVILNFGARPR